MLFLQELPSMKSLWDRGHVLTWSPNNTHHKLDSESLVQMVLFLDCSWIPTPILTVAQPTGVCNYKYEEWISGMWLIRMCWSVYNNKCES